MAAAYLVILRNLIALTLVGVIPGTLGISAGVLLLFPAIERERFWIVLLASAIATALLLLVGYYFDKWDFKPFPWRIVEFFLGMAIANGFVIGIAAIVIAIFWFGPVPFFMSLPVIVVLLVLALAIDGLIRRRRASSSARSPKS